MVTWWSPKTWEKCYAGRWNRCRSYSVLELELCRIIMEERIACICVVSETQWCGNALIKDVRLAANRSFEQCFRKSPAARKLRTKRQKMRLNNSMIVWYFSAPWHSLVSLVAYLLQATAYLYRHGAHVENVGRNRVLRTWNSIYFSRSSCDHQA